MIHPLFNKVLIRPVEEKKEEVTKSGIILPGNKDKKPPIIGTVQAFGPEVKADIQEGDQVVFSEYGFDPIEIDGEKYLIGKDEDILGVIKE